MEIKNIVEIVEIALSVRLSLGSWAVLSLGVSRVYMYSTLFQQNGIETLYGIPNKFHLLCKRIILSTLHHIMML